MENKKIPTSVGTVMLTIIAFTAVMFVWKYEGIQDLPSTQKIIPPTESTQGPQYQPRQNAASPEKTPPDKDGLTEIGTNSESISITHWKAYASKESGYSLQYPPQWLSDFKDGASFYIKEFLTIEGRPPVIGQKISDGLKDTTGDYFINISVYPNIGNHVADTKEWRIHDRGNYKEILIHGYLGLKFTQEPTKESAGEATYYFITNNRDGYEITVWYKDTSDGVAERIISTLSFTN